MGAVQARKCSSTAELEEGSCLQRAKSCLLLIKAPGQQYVASQRSPVSGTTPATAAPPAKLVSLAVSSLKVAPDGSLLFEAPPSPTHKSDARRDAPVVVEQHSLDHGKVQRKTRTRGRKHRGYWGDRKVLHFFLAKCGGSTSAAFVDEAVPRRIGSLLCARGVQKQYEAYVAIGRALRLPRPGWPRTRSSIGAAAACSRAGVPTLRPSQWAGVESTADADGHVISGLKLHKARGTIPSQIGRLSALQTLVIEAGHPRGHIPESLSRLEHLTKLSLSMNKLSGGIPSVLGTLSRLTELSLHGNRLTGPIPTELGSLEQLLELDLCVNHLTGRIPTQLGRLRRLRSVKLHWNRLTGPIPPQLANAESLAVLLLHLNPGLTGHIPTELQQLTALRALSVGINNTGGYLGGEEALAVVPAGLRAVLKVREPHSDPPSSSSSSTGFLSTSSSERSTESSGSDSDSS